MQRSRRIALGSALVALAVAVVVVLLALGLDGDPEPTPTPDAEPTPTVHPESTSTAPTSPTSTVTPACRGGATRGFVPTKITVTGVVGPVAVMALPRDADGVPGVPPLSDKHAFAWDEGGIRPGDPRGNALFNTHTWPDGSASGNALLADLEVGDRIVVRGQDDRLCYEVTEEVEVRVEDGYAPYFATDGPPQLAIVVCSGERRGPGDWSHRTIWFASPVA